MIYLIRLINKKEERYRLAMKEKLYTIPLNDAFNANDECPFCFIEREIERDTLDFVLGSCASYMESDIRSITDQEGFCRSHFKKMYDYGNTIGNAWILKTHFEKMNQQLHQGIAKFRPRKASLKEKIKKNSTDVNCISEWYQSKSDSCYICNQLEEPYRRYLDTFFELYKKEPEFKEKVHSSKGFCLLHFKDLCQDAPLYFSESEQSEFYQDLFRLMEDNMARISNDISWLVEKFDYRNKDADWKTSRDALQRGMQKLKGGYPSDPCYKGPDIGRI